MKSLWKRIIRYFGGVTGPGTDLSEYTAQQVCISCFHPMKDDDLYFRHGVCPYCGHQSYIGILADVKYTPGRWVSEYKPTLFGGKKYVNKYFLTKAEEDRMAQEQEELSQRLEQKGFQCQIK